MLDVPLTPGRLTATWLVLRCLSRLGGAASPSEVLAYASRSSLRSGGLPLRDGIRLAVGGRVIIERTGRFEITELGRHALNLSDEDEPSPEVRRTLVASVLLSEPPAWVAYWQGDPGSLDFVLPHETKKALVGAKLMPQDLVEENLDTWAFWEALAHVPLASETSGHQKIIGNAGEQLSFDYERERLVRAGFPELAQRVSWLARESDAYGFDILSFDGNLSSIPDRPRAIEVKATSLPRSTFFRMHLTAHEWAVARRLEGKYILHLWTGVDPGPPLRSQEAFPTELDPALLLNHVPTDPLCGGICRWQDAEIAVPTGHQA